MLKRAGKFKICRADQQAAKPGAGSIHRPGYTLPLLQFQQSEITFLFGREEEINEGRETQGVFQHHFFLRDEVGAPYLYLLPWKKKKK